MDAIADSDSGRSPRRLSFKNALYRACAPLPVPLINIVLGRLVLSIRDRRPDMFSRLEGHHHKWFLIDPVNLPFALCLRPDPRRPSLKACRKHKIPETDGRISGTFLTLLGMVDGRYDGDALFFTRDLRVEGDTEAVVCLRNALDDMEGSIADDAAAFFGAAGQRLLKIARKAGGHAHGR